MVKRDQTIMGNKQHFFSFRLRKQKPIKRIPMIPRRILPIILQPLHRFSMDKPHIKRDKTGLTA